VDEVQGRIVSGDFFFGNAALEPSQEVLGVALDDELASSWFAVFARSNGIDKQVSELGLDSGVKMNLRLLEDHDRVRRHIKALDDDGKDLADAEAHICELDVRHLGARFDQDFILFAMPPELRHAEISDQSHGSKAAGDEFWQGSLLFARPEIEHPILARQNGLNRLLPLDPYMLRDLS
jgi:hypothetical protein